MVTLLPKERETLRKMGQKRTGYYQDVSDGVNAFPATMPATFPTAEFLKDANLMTAFSGIATQILGLASNVDDTMVQLGSELIGNTDLAYSYLKNSS